MYYIVYTLCNTFEWYEEAEMLVVATLEYVYGDSPCRSGRIPLRLRITEKATESQVDEALAEEGRALIAQQRRVDPSMIDIIGIQRGESYCHSR